MTVTTNGYVYVMDNIFGSNIFNFFFQAKKFQLDNQMNNQNLVPMNQRIIPSNNQLVDVFGRKNAGPIFEVKNIGVMDDADVKYDTKTTIFKNSSESTIRESSLLTKTVIRKKTITLNGEILEQEEEETSEHHPNAKEFSTRTQSIFAKNAGKKYLIVLIFEKLSE